MRMVELYTNESKVNKHAEKLIYRHWFCFT